MVFGRQAERPLEPSATAGVRPRTGAGGGRGACVRAFVAAKPLARLRSAWRRHPPAEFVRLAVHNLALLARHRGATPSDGNPVDAAFGTDTAGIREVGSLDVGGTAACAATRYEPSGAGMVRATLAQLGIDYADYAFVDYGSGKGRVLIVAAGFAFKSVAGVEFSRELHEIAEQNIALLPPEAVRAGVVSALHGDAAAFEPPPGNLVCYLYNPFGPPVISQVARRLASHRDESGCRVIVVYVDPVHRAAFEEIGKFVVVEDRPNILILTTLPAGGETTTPGPASPVAER